MASKKARNKVAETLKDKPLPGAVAIRSLLKVTKDIKKATKKSK